MYIIHGFQEKPTYVVYQRLAAEVKKKGYEPALFKVRFDIPLSTQVFPVKKQDVVMGFSLGAILALLIAQKYTCKALLLCSMTPLKSFTDTKDVEALSDLLGDAFVKDVQKNVKKKTLATHTYTFYGSRENESADVVVPHTGHRLNTNYIEAITNLL